MNEILFLRFFTALATTNADDPDIHAANDYAISLVKSNRAALTRAEAAEAEAQALRGLAVAIQGRLDFELERRQAAEARVAELEAALAAQGWQPVTITEPSLNVMAELIIVGYRGHDGYWYYPDDPDGLVIRGWRPVPPSVALQEPTP